MPRTALLRAGLLIGLVAAAAAGQDRSSRAGPCPPEGTPRDALLAADLAAASRDEARSADLLAGAERAAVELSPTDWLALARRDESRGSFASAAARYRQYLRILAGSAEDTRWVGPRLKQLDLAALEVSTRKSREGGAAAEAVLAFVDAKAALSRGDGKAAREKLGFALRLDAGYADAEVAAASLDAREGRTADAAREYRLALAVEPQRVDAMVPLSNLLWERPDRADKAESLLLLDRAAAARPDLPTLKRRSAERWAEWGDPRAALERLDAWRAGASSSEKKETDRLREDLAARAPRAPEAPATAVPESASAVERPSPSPRAIAALPDPIAEAPRAARPEAAGGAPSRLASRGYWTWGAGAAVLAAIAAAAAYRRRSARSLPAAPAATSTRVEADEMLRILESVASERQLAAPPLAIKGFPGEGTTGWTIRMAPEDWRAMWSAVFANTLAALQASRVASPKLALFATPLRDSKAASLVIRFALADNAPGMLTTEWIHSRVGERDWGVVNERVLANGGSIAVSPSIDRQYTKRLILELCATEPK